MSDTPENPKPTTHQTGHCWNLFEGIVSHETCCVFNHKGQLVPVDFDPETGLWTERQPTHTEPDTGLPVFDDQ